MHEEHNRQDVDGHCSEHHETDAKKEPTWWTAPGGHLLHRTPAGDIEDDGRARPEEEPKPGAASAGIALLEQPPSYVALRW